MPKHLSFISIAFLQALGLTFYISLIATVMSNGNQLFGRIDNHVLGPVLALSLFSLSAIICSLIVGTYPFWIFWEKKNSREAIKVIIATAAWLFLFVILLMSWLIFFK